MPDTKYHQKYHHGDLRQTLLDNAQQEIASVGLAALSMRALARRAGVSATAPYRHFESKHALLAALAEAGFHALDKSIRQAMNPAAPVADRLTESGLAYVRFAQNNPIKYQIMFGGVIDDFGAYPSLELAARGGFSVILELLHELTGNDGEGEVGSATVGATGLDISALGGVIWAVVHGTASLVISNLGVDSEMNRDHPVLGPPESVAALRADPAAGMRLLFEGLVRQAATRDR